MDACSERAGYRFRQEKQTRQNRGRKVDPLVGGDLGSGVNPQTLKGAATGLVVGYVQSGKTLSSTTVIGLARDNGFPLVIFVAAVGRFADLIS